MALPLDLEIILQLKSRQRKTPPDFDLAGFSWLIRYYLRNLISSFNARPYPMNKPK
jgi:hypothetical protein